MSTLAEKQGEQRRKVETNQQDPIAAYKCIPTLDRNPMNYRQKLFFSFKSILSHAKFIFNLNLKVHVWSNIDFSKTRNFPYCAILCIISAIKLIMTSRGKQASIWNKNTRKFVKITELL